MANFGSNTGYAWDLIESYFQGLAKTAKEHGFTTYVCYPDISGGLPNWADSTGTKVLQHDYSDPSVYNTLKFLKLIRKHRIKIMYFIDQETWSIRYLFFRCAGVKKIIIHDHTSGARRVPQGLRRVVKRMIHRVRWLAADVYIGVSRFVVRRLVRVNRVPPEKVHLVYNGINVSRFRPRDNGRLRNELDIPPDKKIVFCSARAAYYKGIHILIDAAQILLNKRGCSDLVFVYCGDGPDLEDFKKKALKLGIERNFYFLGKRDDLYLLLPDADVVVVPSVWQEAFGLAVIEGMACGKAVIGCNVGGVPEIIQNDGTGILIKPNDPLELARSIEDLLNNKEKREKIGERARQYVEKHFAINDKSRELQELLQRQLELI